MERLRLAIWAFPSKVQNVAGRSLAMVPRSVCLLALAVACSPIGFVVPARATPNIVVIYTDDQGYGDVGVYGATGFSTPNLDRLAMEGRRCTSFYSAQPVCSASRAALLTGCYPNRIGIHGALAPRDRVGIADTEVTLAEICKQKGYATAVFGKWHLGWQRPFLPLQHGFDEYLGIPYSNDMWPRNPNVAKLPPEARTRYGNYPPLPLLEGNEVVHADITPEDQERFTTQFTQRAVDFIKARREEPFLLYVPHPMPHVPLYVSEKFRGKSQQGLYGDVIEEIDWSVGQIVGAIRDNGLAENTLVIFASDNGPWTSYGNHAGSAGPLREAKGTTFEGGVRVPCILWWPGRIPAGSVCDEPMMTIDILPTVAGLIGAELPKHKIDGLDIWPLFEGREGARCPHEAYFFYYHVGNLEAMRSGRWKLHFPHEYRTLSGRPGGSDGLSVRYDTARTGLELYDLVDDPGETKNVAEANPEVVARMQSLADLARADLGDRLTGIPGGGVRPPGRVPE